MSEADREIDGLPPAEFGFPGDLRDRLVALIVQGVKTAGAGLLAEYEATASNSWTRTGAAWR
jgi:uncharacterized protein YhfF